MAASASSLAPRILEGLGGADNIRGIENCITRLRIPVADTGRVDSAGLKAIDGVLGVVTDETMQIVLGPGLVDDVARELARIWPAEPEQAEAAPPAGMSAAESLRARGGQLHEEQRARNRTPFKNFLRRIANIFLPLIPALIACGIVAGINGIIQNVWAVHHVAWAVAVTPALTAISTGFMSLIAVFVGFNAAKEFGGTPIIGGAVAAIIPYAGVAKVTLFGLTLAPGQGGVIGALFAAVLAAYVERWVRTWSPRSLSMLIVPTVTVLIAGALALFPLMTVSGWISQGIGVAANWLLSVGGVFAGFVLGGLFLPLVMLGLHQALIPIHTTLIQQFGFTVLLPILAMAGGGQVGASVAVYLKLRNRSIRDTIKSALPAGLLGVGEPLIYGVTLPLGRPFVTACVGGAFGGAFVGLFNQLGVSTGSTAIGPSGWALFALTTGNHGIGPAVAIYAGGLVVAYIAGFLATWFFGIGKDLIQDYGAADSASGSTNGTGGSRPLASEEALRAAGLAPAQTTSSAVGADPSRRV